ncbi:MAG: hypothetical protein Ct9H300mP3_04530 [Gammaproteobacteria bacterium]|nr:MAG: hypothetical protein Ct9H300mP3_04530 [Gammaproteobacteria bacterium]
MEIFCRVLNFFLRGLDNLARGMKSASTFFLSLLQKASLGKNNEEMHNPLIKILSEEMKSKELRDSIELLHKNFFYRKKLCSPTDRQILKLTNINYHTI